MSKRTAVLKDGYELIENLRINVGVLWGATGVTQGAAAGLEYQCLTALEKRCFWYSMGDTWLAFKEQQPRAGSFDERCMQGQTEFRQRWALYSQNSLGMSWHSWSTELSKWTKIRRQWPEQAILWLSGEQLKRFNNPEMNLCVLGLIPNSEPEAFTDLEQQRIRSEISSQYRDQTGIVASKPRWQRSSEKLKAVLAKQGRAVNDYTVQKLKENSREKGRTRKRQMELNELYKASGY